MLKRTHRLSRSTVLADMMTVPLPTDEQHAQPITIDLSAKLLQVFLELLHNDIVVSTCSTTEEWLDVIRICDTFGCYSAKERLGTVLLRNLCPASSAEMYVIASNMDNPQLVYTVLRSVDIEGLRELFKDLEQYARIPARYTQPLLTALTWRKDGWMDWEKWRSLALENVEKM